MLQELSGKDQEKVAEVSRVRVELQEQIGHLQAERTAQGGLKERISALEREIKGTVSFFSFYFTRFFSFTVSTFQQVSQFPIVSFFVCELFQ